MANALLPNELSGLAQPCRPDAITTACPRAGHGAPLAEFAGVNSRRKRCTSGVNGYCENRRMRRPFPDKVIRLVIGRGPKPRPREAGAIRTRARGLLRRRARSIIRHRHRNNSTARLRGPWSNHPPNSLKTNPIRNRGASPATPSISRHSRTVILPILFTGYR